MKKENNLVPPDFFRNLKVPKQTEQELEREKQKKKMIIWLRQTDLGRMYDGKYVAVYNYQVITSALSVDDIEEYCLKNINISLEDITIQFIPFLSQVVYLQETL